jgi:hypothetical protein
VQKNCLNLGASDAKILRHLDVTLDIISKVRGVLQEVITEFTLKGEALQKRTAQVQEPKKCHLPTTQGAGHDF